MSDLHLSVLPPDATFRNLSVTSLTLLLKEWGLIFKSRIAAHPSGLGYTIFLNFSLLSLIRTLCKTLLQDGCHIKWFYTDIKDADILVSRTQCFCILVLKIFRFFYLGEPLASYFGLDIACGYDPERGNLTCHNTTVSFNFKVINISLQLFVDVLLVKEGWPLVAYQWK